MDPGAKLALHSLSRTLTTKSCSGGLSTVFVDAGIPVHIILLTYGGLGIPRGSAVTPDEMKAIRRAEFASSLSAIGATGESVDLPDLDVSFLPTESVVRPVLKIVRERRSGVIFSFHPQETTKDIDHPDHNTAGQTARFVSAAADVTHFFPEYPAPRRRPALYLWTTDKRIATHHLPLTDDTVQQRNIHMETHYPSQFPSDTINTWKVIFDKVTKSGSGKHAEMYVRVR